jgi:hypothetical protein
MKKVFLIPFFGIDKLATCIFFYLETVGVVKNIDFGKTMSIFRRLKTKNHENINYHSLIANEEETINNKNPQIYTHCICSMIEADK